jgi:Phytanoyl-CoA dioxygenase (PhyH)
MRHREELLAKGVTAFPAVLSPEQLTVFQAACDAALARHDSSAFASQGSMLPTTEDPLFADLITEPKALACLAELGFPHPTFSDGYIISKPSGGKRLFWHYDWFAWDDPRSFENPPPQVFLMYYLTNTHRENGCLRAIPGSHLTENPLHRLLAEPHSEALSQGDGGAAFSDRPDEVDFPVRAGDLLIGDARLLHAAHANQTSERRTLITLWYQPDLASLPERMQAQMAAKTQPLPATWPEAAREKLRPLLARERYKGSAEPYERQLWRPRSLTEAA